MIQFGACSRCKLDISEDRRNARPLICNHCGYTHSQTNSIAKGQTEKQTIVIFTSVVIVTVLAFVQLLNWDKYALEMIPLKIKSTIGMTSVSDSNRSAEICMELKKWDCVESNYKTVAIVDPSQLSRLGHFLMKRGKFSDAAQSYYAHFKNGGNDLESSYNYAKALAQLGQVDDATKYFEQVLAARPDVLQVTVIQNYVKLLMDHQRYDQARRLIQDIRGKSPESGLFMESEYKKIKDLTTASRE